MFRFRSMGIIFLLSVLAAMSGCRSNSIFGSPGSNSGNSSVVLAMTDTPPSTVSILSAKVTLTGATLNPGSVTLFSGSTTVELTRLQTDIAYLATAPNIPSGNYTSVTLTFANPVLTIENDTGSSIVSGATTCTVGSICTIAPTTVSNLSATIPLTAFTLASNSKAGLLIDVSLDNLLSSKMGADFMAGTTVSAFTPGGAGAPLVGAEDIVGEAGNINASDKTFTLQNVTGSFSLKVDNTTSFFQFPLGACSTPGFACLQANQILSVDMGIQPDGSLLARNIVFEDSDSSETEVEGMITSTNAGLQQFDIVTLGLSATGTGLNIGDVTTVQYSVAPQTPFDVDFVHADSVAVSTAGYIFAAPADLTVGQQVSILRNSSSTSSVLVADRVRLRSTRVTAAMNSNASSVIDLIDVPSIFSGHGVTDIQVHDLAGNRRFCSDSNGVKPCSNIGPPSVLVSARGPLFNVSGQRTIIATRVVEKP